MPAARYERKVTAPCAGQRNVPLLIGSIPIPGIISADRELIIPERTIIRLATGKDLWQPGKTGIMEVIG